MRRSDGKTRFNVLTYAARCIAVLVAALFFWVISCLCFRHVVTESTSPNGRYHVIVKQPILVLLDRNFVVELIDETSKTRTTIFHSFDQDPSIREERFVWSEDSRWFALVGDKYFVMPDSELPSGLILFLVYDLENDHVYCNTDFEERGFERMTALEAIELFGEGRLEPRPSAE